MMWTILNYIEPYANQFQIMFWAIFKQYWQINAQYCEQNFQPYCSCEHGRLTILLKVLFNIAHDIVWDIAQPCMQCCVQYWLSDCTHCTYWTNFILLYALHKMVQNSPKLYTKLEWSHWSCLQMWPGARGPGPGAWGRKQSNHYSLRRACPAAPGRPWLALTWPESQWLGQAEVAASLTEPEPSLSSE